MEAALSDDGRGSIEHTNAHPRASAAAATGHLLPLNLSNSLRPSLPVLIAGSAVDCVAQLPPTELTSRARTHTRPSCLELCKSPVAPQNPSTSPMGSPSCPLARRDYVVRCPSSLLLQCCSGSPESPRPHGVTLSSEVKVSLKRLDGPPAPV